MFLLIFFSSQEVSPDRQQNILHPPCLIKMRDSPEE